MAVDLLLYSNYWTNNIHHYRKERRITDDRDQKLTQVF